MRKEPFLKSLAIGANAIVVEIYYLLSAKNRYPLPIHTVGASSVSNKDMWPDGNVRYSQDMIGLERTLLTMEPNSILHE